MERKNSDKNRPSLGSKEDEEYQEERLPYPKSVFFIVSNEFCERFSFYGMRTILILYLTNILLYSEGDAKIIYHTFTMFVYFFPVFGAILSDNYIGKFNTILYVSMVYATGSILLGLTSAEPLGIPEIPFSMLGLMLIAIGTGGIKPCVAAFGGDQFVLPQQEKQLAMFFSLFYFSINAGSLISTFLTPILRNNVHCFGANSCFPLAFAVPGVLMVLSIIIFACGKPLYKIRGLQGNIMVDVAKCITYAVGQKCKQKNQVEHWLDRAKDKFGEKLVADIKATLKVLVLYIPLPIFWALYDQQGSGWTFQAVRMDGNVGFYTILPDQMQVVNPLLILLFIPLFSYCVYPLLAKCHLLTTPLQRMTCGGFLAATAFAVSAVVSIFLESTYPTLPSDGNIQLRIYNPSACSYSFSNTGLNVSGTVESMSYYQNIDIALEEDSDVTLDFTTSTDGCTSQSLSANLVSGTAYGIYFNQSGVHLFEDNVEKSEDGYPNVRTLAYVSTSNLTYTHASKDYSFTVSAGNSSLLKAPYPGVYYINNDTDTSVEFKLGGTYTVMLNSTGVEQVTVTQPNTLHIMWLLPQYIIITAAEIMFSITGLEFSYSQAPASMKAVLQACWLLTTAFGNLIIVLIESAKIFDLQSNDFFLYTGLMVVDMLIFMVMAIKYKYVERDDDSGELDEFAGEESKTNGADNEAFSKKATD